MQLFFLYNVEIPKYEGIFNLDFHVLLTCKDKFWIKKWVSFRLQPFALGDLIRLIPGCFTLRADCYAGYNHVSSKISKSQDPLGFIHTILTQISFEFVRRLILVYST